MDFKGALFSLAVLFGASLAILRITDNEYVSWSVVAGCVLLLGAGFALARRLRGG